MDSGVQGAKKVVSNSLGLVDFVIRLVNSVLNLPDGNLTYRRTAVSYTHLTLPTKRIV